MHEVQLPALDSGFLRRKPGQISVGQAQRVLIALALLHRPSILIADEPTSAMDPVTQAEIVGLLRRLTRRNGTALLYISHDLVSVLQLCDRIAVLHGGSVAECVRVAEIEQAQHPATLSLLRSLPVPVRVLLSHLSSVGFCKEQVRKYGRCRSPLSAQTDETQPLGSQRQPISGGPFAVSKQECSQSHIKDCELLNPV